VVTGVDAATEVDELAHLDFEIRCEVRTQPILTVSGVDIPLKVSKPCGNPAIGVIRCRACGMRASVCADHASTICATRETTCFSCSAAGPGVVLFEFTPIGGH